MSTRIKTLAKDDKGVALEYVLLMVVIALAIIAGMAAFATALNGGFGNAASATGGQVSTS